MLFSVQAVNSASSLYQRSRFLWDMSPVCKPFLEHLKATWNKASSQLKLGNIFKSEGLLLTSIMDSDKDAAIKLVRKELSNLAGNQRGVTSEDVHPGLLAVARNLLPS